MEYIKYSFRHAEDIFKNDEDFTYLWNEITDVLDNISDEDIIDEFNSEVQSFRTDSLWLVL